MKLLLSIYSPSEYNAAQFAYVELTPQMVRLLDLRIEYLRDAVGRDEQFEHMSFAERSPELVFKLQDELRPLVANLGKGHVRLPDGTRFSTNTEKEAVRSGSILLKARGFSWRLQPLTSKHEVETITLPWNVLERVKRE